MRSVPDERADAPVEHEALPDNVVDALFSRLTSLENVALAVSGGADSLCLLVLFSEWVRRTGWPGIAEVLVVDHGLRAESTREAEFVVACAREHHLAAMILRWRDTKPFKNIQEEARKARYRLLADRMRHSGAQALLLGHHMDDQAETFLDRLTRGSGVTGLSAMTADEPAGVEGLNLLRPFLGLHKSQLLASLRARGLTWCEDPSNHDDKYKRSRLRRIMGLLAAEGLTPERLAQTADRVRSASEALEATVAELYDRLIEEHAAGPIRFPREAYHCVARDLRLRLLSRVIRRVTGIWSRPRVQQLAALDAAILSGDDCRHTLSATLFEAGPGHVFAWREPGREPPETLTCLEREGVWDNRYRYAISKGSRTIPDLLLGPLCRAPSAGRSIAWPAGWPRQAFDCAPAVWAADGAEILQTASADLPVVNPDDRLSVELERLAFGANTVGNHVGEEDAEAEI